MTEDSARPLGEWLRQRREELDLSLEEAQETTRIRARYLEALEAENLEALPNPVVARGFLRNYAAYLELDPQEAIDRYSGVAGPSEPEPLPVDESNPFDVDSFRPVPLHEMPGPRSRWWILAALLVILVVIVGFLAWQGYPYIVAWLPDLRPVVAPAPTQYATSTPLSTATHTPTTAVATMAGPLTATPPAATPTQATPTQATPTLELTLTPTFTPSPSPTPTEPVYTGIFLELVLTDTSWVQVTVDGVRQFQGELETGTYRSWYGEERVELRVGNAGAVLVTVNGQNLGALGDPGDVVDRVFEIVDDQVSEATPTRLPTGAATEEPSATLTIEPTALPATLQITATATITPTLSSTATANP